MTAKRLILGVVLALAPAGCDDGAKPDAKADGAKADGAKGDKADKGKEAPRGGEDGTTKLAQAGDKGGDAPADGEAGAGAGADADAEADAGADAGAGGEPSDEDVFATLDKRVQRAAKLAKEIEAKPGDATTILEAADLDRAAFEELIYSIGSDPELSKQYQLAMASGPEGS